MAAAPRDPPGAVLNPGRPWDVIVVGAGPAGSVAARGLARDGLRVLLVDRARFPRRKVCGACVGPAAREQLRREGLAGLLEHLGASGLRSLELRAGPHRAALDLDGHCAIGRARLDAALVRAAMDAGVVFRDGTTVRSVTPVDRREGCVRMETSRGAFRTRVVVDAAGLAGTRVVAPDVPAAPEVRVAPDALVAPDARLGAGAVFAVADPAHPATGSLPGAAPPPGVLRMVAGRDGYVGLVRTEDGRLNVAAALAPEAVRTHGVDRAVADVLTSAGIRLPEAAPVERWTGTPALTRRRERLGGGGVLRIGDAAGYVEPFTGEGIGWAIASATAVRPFAAEAVRGWSEGIAEEWTRRHDRVVARGQRTCRALAEGLRRERLVRTAVAILSFAPGLATPVVRATGRAGTR